MDLMLNNLQRLICHKTQTIDQRLAIAHTASFAPPLRRNSLKEKLGNSSIIRVTRMKLKILRTVLGTTVPGFEFRVVLLLDWFPTKVQELIVHYYFT